MSDNHVSQPTQLQSDLFAKVQSFLKDKGINEISHSFSPGVSGGFYWLSFDGLFVFIYDDGGAEISSTKRVDRLLKLIPIKIDWRYETGQYFPNTKLENEFFKGLTEAMKLAAKK